MKWINIVDECPEDHCIVFGRLKGELAHDFHFARSHKGEFWQRDTGETIFKVDYWMPLPEPPK